MPEYLNVFEDKLGIKIQHPEAKEKDNLFFNLITESLLPTIWVFSDGLKDKTMNLGKIRLSNRFNSKLVIQNTGSIDTIIRINYLMPYNLNDACNNLFNIKLTKTSLIEILFEPKTM